MLLPLSWTHDHIQLSDTNSSRNTKRNAVHCVRPLFPNYRIFFLLNGKLRQFTVPEKCSMHLESWKAAITKSDDRARARETFGLKEIVSHMILSPWKEYNRSNDKIGKTRMVDKVQRFGQFELHQELFSSWWSSNQAKRWTLSTILVLPIMSVQSILHQICL